MKTKPSEHFVRMYLNGKIHFWIKKIKFLSTLSLFLFSFNLTNVPLPPGQHGHFSIKPVSLSRAVWFGEKLQQKDFPATAVGPLHAKI